jgi:hypothetical protein
VRRSACLQHQVQHCARPSHSWSRRRRRRIEHVRLAGLVPASPQSSTTTPTSANSSCRSDGKIRHACRCRFALFDIDRTAEPQGIAPGSLDLILASNVLHNALDLDASLSYLGSLRRRTACWCCARPRAKKAAMGYRGCSAGSGAGRYSLQHRHSRLRGTDEWIEALGASGYEPIGAYPMRANGLRRPASVGGPVEQGCRGM